MPDSQLSRLAKPFPAKLIKNNPNGYGQYVKHSVVTEKVLAVLGPVSFEVVEVIRGDAYYRVTDNGGASPCLPHKDDAHELIQVIVGCRASLTATIDGESVTVTEVGDCEIPSNWQTDGARLKDAASDAYKRCAMRLSVGLHLWSGDQFSLAGQLEARDRERAREPYIATPGDLDAPGKDSSQHREESRPGEAHDDASSSGQAQQHPDGVPSDRGGESGVVAATTPAPPPVPPPDGWRDRTKPHQRAKGHA